MTPDDFPFFPLQVIHIGAGGRRTFEPEAKRQLIEAYLRPGVSISGMALKV